MLQLPKKGIILAPASLHLPLYDRIVRQHGNTLDLQVMTLQSFAAQFFKESAPGSMESIYQAKEALSKLSPSNPMREFGLSYDFIRTHLQFLRFMYTHDLSVEDLPESGTGEKALKEILSLLSALKLQEKEIPSVLKQSPSFEDVYILAREFDEDEWVWVDWLIKNNAHMIKTGHVNEKHYLSCSNIAKQAACIARILIEKNMDADEVFVMADGENSRQALAFAFERHNIPYTFVSRSAQPLMIKQFRALLRYIATRTEKSCLEAIDALFPQTRERILPVFKQFPELLTNPDSSLLPDAYQENEILDAYAFALLQKNTEAAVEWIQENGAFLSWTYQDLSDALALLQSINEPVKENLNVFYSLQDLCTQAYPYLKQDEDLLILADALENKHAAQSVTSIQGVLIGFRKELTAMRDIVFICDAHAKTFPGYSTHQGLYSESLLAKTSYMPLDLRLERQRSRMLEQWNSCSVLYAMVPEASFDGKENPTAYELDSWFGCRPEFQEIPDISIKEKPAFMLDPDMARQLFFKDDRFKGSVSQLESFARCPLQHFLNYGLYLRPPKDSNDVRVKGSIYHHILEILIETYGKAYPLTEKKNVKKIIDREFAFAEQVFVHNTEFAIQKQEILHKIMTFLHAIKGFEVDWSMEPARLEYNIRMELEWEGMPVLLYGYIDRIDASKSAFVLFDYKSSDKDIAIKDFQAGLALQLITYTIAYQKETGQLPYGCFYISLKTTAQNAQGIFVNYKKKKPEVTDVPVKEQYEAALSKRKLKGLTFQDLSVYGNKNAFVKKKDQPSFEDMHDQWQTVLFSLLDEMDSGDIAPNHEKDACTYCAYRAICRNAAQETEKPNRLEVNA